MQIDTRIKQLSYSAMLNLHSCPRRYQLDRLQAVKAEDETNKSSVTFATGHVIGQGIQHALEERTEDEIIWQAFLMWDPDLLDSNPKQNKSFWECIAAIQAFISLRNDMDFLSGWKLHRYVDATGQSRPACELSFLIHLPDGFVYRGFVDAVLQHEDTGEIMVLELKTTSSYSVNAATYKNSAQAIGYSVILDVLFPEASSYEVLYLVYKTKTREYESLPFTKSYLQRALWIRELLLDIEVIKMYSNADCFPMHGESCLPFFRECEYLHTCTLSTEFLTEVMTPEDEERLLAKHEEYEIHITLNDLINSQLAKS